MGIATGFATTVEAKEATRVMTAVFILSLVFYLPRAGVWGAVSFSCKERLGNHAGTGMVFHIFHGSHFASFQSSNIGAGSHQVSVATSPAVFKALISSSSCFPNRTSAIVWKHLGSSRIDPWTESYDFDGRSGIGISQKDSGPMPKKRNASSARLRLPGME